MDFRSRRAGFVNGRPAPVIKNWVIGWTPDEARTAAQYERTNEVLPPKTNAFSAPVHSRIR